MFRGENSDEVTENPTTDLERETYGGDSQNEEQTGQQEDMDAPVTDINGRAGADGTAASTTAVAIESGSSKRDGGSSSSSDGNMGVEFHKKDGDQNGGAAYPDPPKKRGITVEDVDPSRKFHNGQFEEKRDEPSSLQEEIQGKESDQPEKREGVVEIVPSTSRNETQTLASRHKKSDDDSQLEETEKHVGDGISQSDGTAQKTEENVENGRGSPQVEVHGDHDDTDQYEKRDSNMVNSPLKRERGNISVYKVVRAIDSFAGTETQSEYDSQLEEGMGNGGTQSDETLQKTEEIVKSTRGNPQGETHGDQIDRCQTTDFNMVNSPSKREGENNGDNKAIEGLQVGPKYIHGEIDHGHCQGERSDGFKGILESVSEGTHGVASGLAESKNDMQKEIDISRHRDTSTKSLEQLDVQEDPSTEEQLEERSLIEFNKNLTGVEDISEVNPIEGSFDIEDNVEAINGKIKEINPGVTVVKRESRLGATMYTLSSTVETYRTSVVYSEKDGLLLQGGSSSTPESSALTENFDHADMKGTSHPRLKIVHQFPREGKTGEERHGGGHEASTSKSAERESESEVERILRLQQTHELLCPNCGSCITKRVILRKRKRTTAVSADKWEQDVLDQEDNIQFVEQAEDEVPMEEYEEYEDWGCLGCFTFLFRRVRGIRRRAGLATSEEARAVKSDGNCLPILFKWRQKADSVVLTPLLRHDESSEVTTRSRELLVEEAETAELREQLETSLAGENVQIPVIVYESAMLEKTQDRICFPFSWSRTTKTTKVTQALREPLLEQPQTEDFTQVPNKLMLPTEEVSISVAPYGPSATSPSSVVVDYPEVFLEPGSSNPLVAVPVGEHDADCNCLPSFPWGPSGRILDQKDLVKQEEQVRIVAVGDQAIRVEPRVVASKGSELLADARIKENQSIEATVVTVGSRHVPLSPTVESPSLPEVSRPLLSNEGSRSSEVTGIVLTSSELEKAQDRICLPLSWSRTTRITEDTREGRKEKIDAVLIPVEQTTVRRFVSDAVDTVATTEGLKEVAVTNMSTVADARQIKVMQRENSKCLPLSLPTLSWRRRQENKADEYVEEMNLVEDAAEKEDQSRLLREEAQPLLQESSKNKLQETGQENEETGVLRSEDLHSKEYYGMHTDDDGEEEPLVRKVHARQLTKDQLELLKQDKEAEYSINALAPKMNEKEKPSGLPEPSEGGEPLSQSKVDKKLQEGKQKEEEIEVTRSQDAYFTERLDMHTASMSDRAEDPLLRKTRTQELTEDQVGQEPITVEIEDHSHPEPIPTDYAYFGGSLPGEQLPRESEHAAQEIKEENFPIGRPIDYTEKEERNVAPQDVGTYYREEVREMGSWDCCLPAYSWSNTRTLEAERPAENTSGSKFTETSNLEKIREAIEVVTEETTKPPLGQAEEKQQTEYFTQKADELLLSTGAVSISITPLGPSSDVSSSVVVDTPEVVAESGHSTPLVAAPVSERGADCNCLPLFPWGPSGRTLNQKDVVKQEKEVLIDEVVEQAIPPGPPLVASGELANVGIKEEEPTEASVITVGLIDVPLSPTGKSPSLSVDRVEGEKPRVLTEPTPSVERKPDISASAVIEGEVLATPSQLEPEVTSELPEISGIDDEPRRAGLNCMEMCLPSYPWGSEATTTRRETTEKSNVTKFAEPSSLDKTREDIEVLTRETVEPFLGQEVGEPHSEDYAQIKDELWLPTEEFSVSDGVKQEKEVLIHEVVEQAILAGPPIVASGERQFRADVGTKEEEPTDARVITVGSIDVPLSPTVKSPSLSESKHGLIDCYVERKPDISASIVVDIEGEVVATYRDLELAELPEGSGIDDEPRKAGINCIGVCLPSYPWGAEAGTTRRDGPKEKLETIPLQIEQSRVGKFVSDTVTRTIPQPHKEAEKSTEGLIGREVVLPVTNLPSIVDARQIKVIRTEDSKCLPLALPTLSWGRRRAKTVEYYEEKETPSRLYEPSDGALPLLQEAEQEDDEVEALRSRDPQSTKQYDMDTELITEEEPLVRKARMPAVTEDQIELSKEDSERLDPVSALAPKMIEKEKASRISEPSQGGEPLSQVEGNRKLQEGYQEDEEIEVSRSQDADPVEQHDMHTASMDELADEEPSVRQARMWDLTKNQIELLKQDNVRVDSVSALAQKMNEKDNAREQSESSEEAPSLLQKKTTEKLQRAGQEDEEEEVLLREPQKQELIEDRLEVSTQDKEGMNLVIALAPKMNENKKPRRLPEPGEEGEPLFKEKECKKLQEVEQEDAGIDVPGRQDSHSTEHFDMHTELMDNLAEEELLVRKARMSKLREDRIEQLKQDTEVLVPFVQKARTLELAEDQVELLQQGPGEQVPGELEPVAKEIKEEETSSGRPITQIEREEEKIAPRHVGTYDEEIREMGSWDCCLPAYSWRSTRTLRADASVPAVSVRERTSMDELQQPLLEPENYRAKGISIEEADVTTTAVRVIRDNTVIEVHGDDTAGTLEVATAAAEECGMMAEPAEPVSQDYLKSIVYGGLDVSLTSLGVVASAAGGGAKTRTVLALGLANLVFGFIAFNHKIINFHRDQPACYKLSVGQRFWPNSLLAILSFVVFGSLPPLTYGFSFRRSNDFDYKMAATVAVSVIAIVLLGCGKVAAKMTEQSYVKTLSALILTGVVVAVAGFFTAGFVENVS